MASSSGGRTGARGGPSGSENDSGRAASAPRRTLDSKPPPRMLQYRIGEDIAVMPATQQVQGAGHLRRRRLHLLYKCVNAHWCSCMFCVCFAWEFVDACVTCNTTLQNLVCASCDLCIAHTKARYMCTAVYVYPVPGALLYIMML